MRNLLKNLLILGLISLLPVAVWGQAISGDIVGTVRDSSGAVVADATVDATQISTNLKSTTKTNSTGEFHFVNLPAGRYTILVTTAGLKGGSEVEVKLNQTATANITASVAGSATTVEVSGAVATIDTTTPQIQSTFESKQAQDIPWASNNSGSGVLNLSLLDAGVASGGGIGAGTGPSVSGQRPRNNNFTIEGVDNNDKSTTGPLVQVPNDAVDQFTVLQNQFAPEFGHSSGGQFNQTIKSGSNQFHGRLYEYFENKDLNAIDTRNALAQIANGETPFNPRYDNNRWGGQVGGPIIKNRLFFFDNAQYNSLGQAGTTGTAIAPTASGYAMLSSLYPGSNNLAVMQKYVPAASSQSGFICAVPLPDGVNCPAGQLTVPAGNLSFSGPSYFNTFTNTASIDFNISSADQLRFRYVYEKQNGIDTAAQIPAFWQTIPYRYHTVALSEYHTFTPSLTNEFRFGFNRFFNTTPSGPFTFGSFDFPNITLNDLSGLNIGPDSNAPQETIQNTYQGVDNVSWVKGKHNFKFGAEYREYITPQSFTQRVRGDYQYSSTALFAEDQAPDVFGERSAGNIIYHGNQQAVYLYGNDEWRITPNLSLNLGLRYELTTVPLAQSEFQPLNAISDVPGLITFGAPQKQTKNFAPRVGFAYSPGSSGDTSIRGGFSMAYDVLYDNLGILSLPPQLSQTCDIGNPACNYSQNAFLANGGMPAILLPITDPATARGLTAAFDPNQKLPYSETWTLGIQHTFAKKYVAEVRYVGTRGIHLPVQQRMNIASGVTPSNALPTYLSAPTQAQLDALPNTLDGPGGLLDQSAFYGNGTGGFVPAYFNAGFYSDLVSFQPWGASRYNGLQTQLSRSFTNGLQFQAAWTWSHNFDNSTADVFSTYLTPRRSQDFQCYSCEWSTSALDRRHRVTLEAIYDLPFLKNANWFMKNVVGNWEFVPVYTFESPEMATVQSGVDANLNGDSAGDRTIYNPAGIPNTGSGVTPLLNSSGYTVAYLANNPNAQYITASYGALANAPRNTLAMPHINNWDMSVVKRFNITERQSVEFQAQALNIFNHPQFTPGYINDIASLGQSGSLIRTILLPDNANFNQPNLVFSSNPRTMTLVLKYIF